jgi:hypothetical protein
VTGIGPKHAERIVAGWQAQIEADDESVVAVLTAAISI